MQDIKIVNKVAKHIFVWMALLGVLASTPMISYGMMESSSDSLAGSSDESSRLGKRKREEKGKKLEENKKGGEKEPDQKRIKESEIFPDLEPSLMKEMQVDSLQKNWTEEEVAFCKKYYGKHPSKLSEIPELRIDASKLDELVPFSHLVWELVIDDPDDRCLSHLTRFPNLTYLNLDEPDKESKITDEGLKYLPSGLKALDLFGCYNITDASIDYILRSAETLEELDLCWTQISDNGISKLFQNCINLKRIRLEECPNFIGSCFEYLPKGMLRLGLYQTKINDVGLVHVADRCPDLINLDLGECKEVSDQGIAQVLASCKSLRKLKIEDTEITTDAFESLEEPLTALARLKTDYEPNDPEFQIIAEKCPNLRIKED